MTDLAVAFGLVLVIEGLLWALTPHTALKMLEMAAETPPEQLKKLGTAAVAAGVAIVWLARG
ncbi:MAG: DUF2065 domain-containing protein [Hyphomicrobium sp.]